MLKSNIHVYFLILVLTSLFSCEPDPTPRSEKVEYFVKLYGGLLQEEGFDLMQTSDGGYLLVGSSNTPGISQNANKDIYVIKVNSVGNEEWTFTYGGTEDDIGRSVIEKTGGGYIIAGSYGFPNGNSTAILIELNSNGGKTNDIRFNSDQSFSTIANDVKEISTDQYLVTGTTTDPNAINDPNDPQDILVFLVNSFTIDASTNRGFGSFDYGVGGGPVFNDNNTPQTDEFLVMGTAFDSPLQDQDLANNSDNIVFFTANYSSGGFSPPTSGPRFGLPDLNQEAMELQRINRGYAVLGSSNNAGLDVFFLTVKDAGLTEDINTTFDLGGGDDVGVSVKQLSQGQYIITGNTNSFSTDTNNDIFLLKLDTDGSVLPNWLAEPRLFGFTGDDRAGKVISTTGGGYAIVGTITIDGSSPDDQNRNTMICLIKTDSEGRLGGE